MGKPSPRADIYKEAVSKMRQPLRSFNLTWFVCATKQATEFANAEN